MSNYQIFSLLLGYMLCVVACSPDQVNDDLLYEKEIFTENANQPKIKEGDQVTFYYCLKNGSNIIMSSDQAIEPAIVTIPNDSLLDKFQRPLTWLGLGDSCIVHIDINHLGTELATYKDHFSVGDKATFIYKVLKID